jgi:small subunit ribosomal protein S6
LEKEQEKKLYEMAFLMPANFELKEIEEYLTQLKTKIQNLGGEITAEPSAQKRKLAYLIKRQSQAYFIFLRFRSLPDKISELNKDLRLDSKLLRYVFIAITPQQITEEEKLTKQMKREVVKRQKVVVKEKPLVQEIPKKVKAEEFEEKMKEVEKAIE